MNPQELKDLLLAGLGQRLLGRWQGTHERGRGKKRSGYTRNTSKGTTKKARRMSARSKRINRKQNKPQNRKYK